MVYLTLFFNLITILGGVFTLYNGLREGGELGTMFVILGLIFILLGCSLAANALLIH